MTQVALPLGAPDPSASDSTRVNWLDLANGLGDAGALADPSGSARAPVRLFINTANNQILFRIVETPDGSTGTVSGQALSDEWEGYLEAVTVRADGIGDLALTGPAHASNAQTDTSEPYSWQYPTAQANDIADWINAYDALSTTQKASAVCILDDGESLGSQVQYTPADVSVDTEVTLRCVATVRGTGMNAKVSTSAMVTAEETFMVLALADADAPALALTMISAITEDQTAELTATPTGGTYDTIAYLWSIESGGGTLDTTTGGTVVYTPADISTNTSVTIRCTATAEGTGTNAKTGTSDTVAAEEMFMVHAVFDAAAPTLALTDITSITEDQTAELTATTTGGLYDTIAYAWSVQAGSGSLDTATGSDVVYTPGDISASETVTIRCAVTVQGTGTVARDETTDTVTVEETFMAVALSDADAPTLALTDITSITEDQMADLTATPSGGTYDTIEYTWEIVSGGGSLSAQ